MKNKKIIWKIRNGVWYGIDYDYYVIIYKWNDKEKEGEEESN